MRCFKCLSRVAGRQESSTVLTALFLKTSPCSHFKVNKSTVDLICVKTDTHEHSLMLFLRQMCLWIEHKLTVTDELTFQ